MADIVIVTWDGGGNVPPALAIARGSRREVTASAFWATAASATPSRRPASRSCRSVTRGSSPPATCTPLARCWRCSPTAGWGATCSPSWPVARPLVVVDTLLLGVLDTVRRAGVPYAVLEHFYDDLPPGRPARPARHGAQAARPAPGPLTGRHEGPGGDLPAGLDPVAAAPNLCQVGPVVTWEPRVDADPGVLVSLSTFGFPGMADLLQRVVDACSGLPARVVVTTGPLVAPSDLRVPAGVEVHRFVPHAALMARSTLLVGHGGHGTTMQALAHDLPVLVLPMDDKTDQPLVGRSVERAGAGHVLHRTSSVDLIGAAVGDLAGRRSAPRGGGPPRCAGPGRWRGARRCAGGRGRSRGSGPPLRGVKTWQDFGSEPPCKAFTHLRSRLSPFPGRRADRTARGATMPRPRLLAALAAGAALVGVPAVMTASPAVADHTPVPSRVTLMGSLMNELGCQSDWSENCTTTDLLPVPGSPTLFARTFTVPAGDPDEPFDYLYKVRLNGGLDRELRRRHVRPPRRQHPPGHRQDHDAALHLRPRDPPGPGRPGGPGRGPDRCRPGHGRRQPAQGPHPRELLLRDGRPLRERHEGQRHGRHRRHPAARTASTRPARASTTAATSRGSSSGSTTSRASAPRPIWMTPVLQEQAGPGRGRVGVGRLPRLLDHRLHPDRPPPRHQRRAEDPHRPRAQARHQGLLRHHHQPHRRRARLPRLGLRRHRPGAVQDQGGGSLQGRLGQGRSTTVTSPSSATRSRRSTRR